MAEKVERRELLKRLWLLIGAGAMFGGTTAVASRYFRSVHVKGVIVLQGNQDCTNEECTNDDCLNSPCTNDPCTNGVCTNDPCTNPSCP